MLVQGSSGSLKRQLFSPGEGKMAIPNTVFANRALEVVSSRQLVQGRPQPLARAIALEAIAAQSNRGNWELSSAAMWNRYIHHRPMQRHLRRVWECSPVGAPGQRYAGRLRLSRAGAMVACSGRFPLWIYDGRGRRYAQHLLRGGGLRDRTSPGKRALAAGLAGRQRRL